ncbi:hypothetical protein SDC9_205643 [bioreactor metagenome]|uniref:Uncharacterized protein n=1 Tax=bioreactor metagenome TaxID=1076179 RepID=A0A645J3H0_9ZZZZ
MIALFQLFCSLNTGFYHFVRSNRRVFQRRIGFRAAVVPAGRIKNLQIALFHIVLKGATGADADEILDAAAGKLFHRNGR